MKKIVVINIPVIRDINTTCLIKEKLFIPAIFNNSNSLFSWRFKKKSWDVIKKINGNISNKIEGEFKNVKRIG